MTKRSRKRRRVVSGEDVGEMNGFPLRRVKVSSIHEADYNPRDIAPENLRGLKNSVDRFGLPQPIVVNERTGNVVGGHQRLKTLDPDSETDVVVVDLSAEEEKALNVALNNPATQGRWTGGLADLLADIGGHRDLMEDLRLDDLMMDAEIGGGSPYSTEMVDPGSLSEHPKNYRDHPEKQLDQIAASIRQQGFYKNVAVAKDGTILAGHGVVKASKKMGLKRIPVRRLDISPDDPRALKLVAGDNELGRLADVDDGALEKLLKEVMEEAPGGLLGTGFDDDLFEQVFSDDSGSDAPGEDLSQRYSRKIVSPVYEPRGAKPSPDELYDRTRTDEILRSIEEIDDLPDEVRRFLANAAERHTSFRFDRIAEYYAHASPEVQGLMEESALVIIDFNRAIELGYAKLADTMLEQAGIAKHLDEEEVDA